ncbi:MAG: signal peptidase I [Candidatus Nomurabacteria bacterium]|nr:signal peptidase I [Candidatus Nomurabacteria bacterium]
MEKETSEDVIVNKDLEKKLLWKQSFWELVKFAIIAIIIVIPIRVFIAQPFIVSGSSMIPTFQDRQYLIIDEISYRFSDPKRGDVIVFHYPNDPSKFFIKRIIGLPNEKIELTKGEVTIINNDRPEGFKLDQSFIENHSYETDAPYQLKDKEYFVMGDNRSGSYDSRAWGAVPQKLITGRVLLRLLPLNKISTFPGNYKQLN